MKNLKLYPGDILKRITIWDFRSGAVRYELMTDYGTVVVEITSLWDQKNMKTAIMNQVGVEMLKVEKKDYLSFIGNLILQSHRELAPTMTDGEMD